MNNISGSRSLLIHVSASLMGTNTTFKITNRHYLPWRLVMMKSPSAPQIQRHPWCIVMWRKQRGSLSNMEKQKQNPQLHFAKREGKSILLKDINFYNDN